MIILVAAMQSLWGVDLRIVTPGNPLEKMLQAAWMDGCRTGAVLTAIAAVVLYLVISSIRSKS